MVKVDANLNSKNYINSVSFNLLPDYENREIFQHNSAPCNASHAKQSYFMSENVQLLEDKPPQSSDLNIIEWGGGN